MLQQKGLARILSNTSPDEDTGSSSDDHSNEIKTYNLRRIIFGDASIEEVQDLYTNQTWGLIERSAASGDRILVFISGDLKRERIAGTTLPLYESPEKS
jgi:hypothetical protein